MKTKTKDFIRKEVGPFLSRYGFGADNDGLTYTKNRNGLIQGILFLEAKYKDQIIVICSLAESSTRALDSEFLSDEDRQRLTSSTTKFCLSPVAPFQGTYDWDFGNHENGIRSIEEIKNLLLRFGFPVFSSIDSLERLAEVRVQTYSERIEEQVSFFLGKMLSDKSFKMTSAGAFLWKLNGQVSVIILPSVLGFGCFLGIYLILWSPLLNGESGDLSEPPSDFSRVAFAQVTREGITSGKENNALWFIGYKGIEDSLLGELKEILLSPVVNDWLVKHQTLNSLFELIAPELRPIVQRRISTSGAST